MRSALFLVWLAARLTPLAPRYCSAAEQKILGALNEGIRSTTAEVISQTFPLILIRNPTTQLPINQSIPGTCTVTYLYIPLPEGGMQARLLGVGYDLVRSLTLPPDHSMCRIPDIVKRCPHANPMRPVRADTTCPA